MRIAICDDQKQERQTLILLLEQVLKNFTVTEFDNGEKLAIQHEERPFDMIFLDIIMQGLSGVETAEIIRKTDTATPIVFVSTSEEFGVASYRVLAFDYLLKPVDKKLLSACVRRFYARTAKKHFLSVPYGGVDTKILLSNIVCVESNLHKINFLLTENRELTISGKLSDYEVYLSNHHFIRCHKSYLVNVEHIESIIENEFLLTGGKTIKISRTYQNEAKKQYFDFVFGGGTDE